MKIEPPSRLGFQGINGAFEGAAEAAISKVEQILEVRLPDDYKAFLRDFGASLFTEDVVYSLLEPSPWTDQDGTQVFDMFYGVHDTPGFDVSKVNLRLRNNFPPGAIAIGHDSGANPILLSTTTNEVLFFENDTGKTFLVAKNFKDFLDSFH